MQAQVIELSTGQQMQQASGERWSLVELLRFVRSVMFETCECRERILQRLVQVGELVEAEANEMRQLVQDLQHAAAGGNNE